MYDYAATGLEKINTELQELVNSQPEEVSTEPSYIKVDWLEAKSEYLIDRTLTYRDISEKYKVSLKQVKKHGARDNWSEGRQEVSDITTSRIQDSLIQQAENTNLLHLEYYTEAEETIMAYVEILHLQTLKEYDEAEQNESAVRMENLPDPAMILSLCKSLTVAINGERVCLGLPTS